MMKEVEARRVGVRWDPPALIYVYQLGEVLRMARIPIRNLEDEKIVDKIYEKHGTNILRGLERRYVERMMNILRHHHGLEFDQEKKSEKTTSDKQSELINSSEIQSSNKNDKSDKKDNVILNKDLFSTNKLISIEENKPNRLLKRRNGSDILQLLNQASQNIEEKDSTMQKNNSDIKITKDIENNQLKISSVEKDQKGTKDKKNEFKNGILELINQDLNTVQKEKQNLVNLVNTNNYQTHNDKNKNESTKNKDIGENSDAKKNSANIESKDEIKTNIDDNSEDTDLDLDDVDIPFDPEEPKKSEIDILDDDDFWS